MLDMISIVKLIDSSDLKQIDSDVFTFDELVCLYTEQYNQLKDSKRFYLSDKAVYKISERERVWI